MSSALLQRPGVGPIEAGTLYPLPDLQARSGLGSAAFREMRRSGLRVKYVAGRAYILGSWFINFVQDNGKDSK
jgi:hypothetical protein